MSMNINRVGEVGPNTVGAEQLKVGAVDLSGDRVTGTLDLEGIRITGQLPNSKLGPLSVAVDNLQANAVSLAKADKYLRLSKYISDETPVQVPGTDGEKVVKEFSFTKVAGKFNPVEMVFFGTVRTNDAGYTATLKVYLDDEAIPRISFPTTEAVQDAMASEEVDISDITAGRHICKIALISGNPAGIAYNNFVDIRFVMG